jgi:23S rRNA pseudouridine2605 synthase
MAQERLQKFLARAGVASRRRAEELISQGRVAVNDRAISQLGTRVDPDRDRIAVDGRAVEARDAHAYFIFYKPAGVVTTLSDPAGRAMLADFFRSAPSRLFPVGRLDYDAEGALILTDDGALAHRLAHPRFGVQRTYLAKVKGFPSPSALQRLRSGVRLEDGPVKPISVDLFRRAERNTWLAIVVAEGRPHLIKRLCAAVGHRVVRLFRPSYAGVGVAGMKPGELRPLRAAELALLRASSAGQAIPDGGELFLPARRHRSSGGAPGQLPGKPRLRKGPRRHRTSLKRPVR